MVHCWAELMAEYSVEPMVESWVEYSVVNSVELMVEYSVAMSVASMVMQWAVWMEDEKVDQ